MHAFRHRTIPGFRIHAVKLQHYNLSMVKDWCGGRYYSTPPGRMVTGLSFVNPERQIVLFDQYLAQWPSGQFAVLAQKELDENFEPMVFPVPKDPPALVCDLRQAVRTVRDLNGRLLDELKSTPDRGQAASKHLDDAGLLILDALQKVIDHYGPS